MYIVLFTAVLAIMGNGAYAADFTSLQLLKAAEIKTVEISIPLAVAVRSSAEEAAREKYWSMGGKNLLAVMDAYPNRTFPVKFVAETGADIKALVKSYSLAGRKGVMNAQNVFQPNLEISITRDEALKIAADRRVTLFSWGDPGWGDYITTIAGE